MPRLIDLVRTAGRQLVVPLLGYPGAQLTCWSLKQNEFNPVLHCESICRLVDRFSPDAAFFMMDLSVEAGALGLPVRYRLYQSPTVEEHRVRSRYDLEAFGVRRAVRALLDSMEPYENFILSTGCELPYETPFENTDAFMREGRL
ncbi:MAG: uroporphyrinogen decarboxylase family protein [Bacillota bacterium]